jgi:hypothetical protein
MPIGAFPIAKARDNGMRPAEQIIVSLCGWRPGIANPQVLVTGPNHCWDFMAGLEALVFVQPGAKYLAPTLRALAEPCETLSLWDVERRQGLDVWPVWKGLNVPEVRKTLLSERRGAIFLRWESYPWSMPENARFGGMA